jgi:alpha-L-fucosidase
MAWYREAKFGMFVHWGVYSALGGYWQGKKVDSMGEWIMCMGKIPIHDYLQFAKTSFNPVKFNANTWADIIQDAGMKYLVVTAKHHDGFAMYNSKASPNNIVAETPYGRDPLKDLVKACGDRNIQLGFYYSQSLDWINGGAITTHPWDPSMANLDQDYYVETIVLPQLKELLTQYQPAPKVLWWDWGSLLKGHNNNATIYNEVRELDPSVILNSRLQGMPSDFEVKESGIPFHAPTDRGAKKDWETCMTLNGTWGYRSDDTNWKSTETLLRMLCDVNSKGGNFLLNIGPDGLGQIPDACVERLKAMGGWIKKNGEAIYGSESGPFANSFTWGRVGKKGGVYNLFVWQWPSNGRIDVPLSGTVQSVSILGYPGLTVSTKSNPVGIEVALPAKKPDESIVTIALHFNGEPTVLPYVIQPDTEGTIVLTASECDLTASDTQSTSLTFDEPRLLRDWRKANFGAFWTANIPREGNYAVTAIYANDRSKAGSPFKIMIGSAVLEGTTQPSAHGEKVQPFDLGMIKVTQKGPLKVMIQPTSIARDTFMTLQEIRLKPVP